MRDEHDVAPGGPASGDLAQGVQLPAHGLDLDPRLTAHVLDPARPVILSPERIVEDAEQRREVRRALMRLPERTAAVLMLRHSGLSYAEVATALGIKVGNVGTLLRRAEEALRKEVDRATPE